MDQRCIFFSSFRHAFISACRAGKTCEQPLIGAYEGSVRKDSGRVCVRECVLGAAEIPGPDVLERALTVAPVPRPVPNLGYACLNMALREQRPPIYTNRDCIKKTLDERGLPWVSALALENARALAAIVQWNWEHNIHFFRCGAAF